MLTRKQWVEENVEFAREVSSGTGIFPETLLAMAIVESQYKVNGVYYPGQSPLALKGQNYFGIKKGVGWTGATIKLPTPNDADPISEFRKYSNFKESAKDFIKFLQTNPRYNKAGVFKAPSYVEQIVAIAKAGYAESPSYTSVITSVANSVKKQIDKIISPIVKNNAIMPLLISGLIVTLYIIKKKYYA